MDAAFLMEVETLAAVLDQLDYYGVLKLQQTATPAEIKAAYYRESRAYHPDRYAALPSAELKEMIGKIYRRVNEAYTVLRDDRKRVKYLADVTGPEREKKLRFTEADEAQVKEGEKKKIEEQMGQTPNGRKLYATALLEIQAQRWDAAQRALKSALMYEPQNARFKEQLAAVVPVYNEAESLPAFLEELGAVPRATALRYEILQAPIPRLSIELPASQALTRIQGEQIRDWQIKADGSRQVLLVEFIKPVEKACALTLFSEQTLEATPITANLLVPQPLEVGRESGSLTLTADDTTVEIQSAPGLRQVNAPAGALAAIPPRRPK